MSARLKGKPRDLRQVREALVADRPPVRPELLAAIEYTAITREGVLRHASFKGLQTA